MDFVRVFFFDFSKAFESVPHAIVCNKLMSLKMNPYVINWIVSFLSNRKQRVVVDGFVTEIVSINRGVPQGTVLGPILFSIFMVNDIRPVYPERNLLLKYADFTNYYLLRNRDFCEKEDMILFYLLLKQNVLRDRLLIGVFLISFNCT